MANIITVVDDNKSNSKVSVNIVDDDNRSNFMANITTVVDDNKSNSKVSVNIVDDDNRSNFMANIITVVDDNKSNYMVSVNKVADENEANFNVNTVDDYINQIVSVCLYITTVTAQRPRTCRNTCEMSCFSGVCVDQPT